MKSLCSYTPVILCGGSGTRLWPLSRMTYPKQFLSLYGSGTLFQQSIIRAQSLKNLDMHQHSTLIVTNEAHRFLVLDQLRELNLKTNSSMLLEPEGKNTAPALTFAALEALQKDPETILVVTPADHIVEDHEAFENAMHQAIQEANLGSIVTLGILPKSADTGYGYIQFEDAECNVLTVKAFKEKPQENIADTYLKDGHYLWNAGIFIMKANIWLEAVKRSRPDILDATTLSFDLKTVDGYFIRPSPEDFKKIPAESIDYAVMESAIEKGFSVKVIKLQAGWDDLGGWDRVFSVNEKDKSHNVIRGDIHTIASDNNLILSNHRLVTTVGVNNLMIIETSDAILVANRAQAELVKTLVNELNLQSRIEVESPRKVHRPWGWYDTIEEGKTFKVKRIQVKPGASLSLQKHEYRSEHWVVIEGEASITSGSKTFKLKKDESTYIPQGTLHRLSNETNQTLEIIEVQSGNYVGEDDIVRIDDVYGRSA